MGVKKSFAELSPALTPISPRMAKPPRNHQISINALLDPHVCQVVLLIFRWVGGLPRVLWFVWHVLQ